jgi:hypothetical protein
MMKAACCLGLMLWMLNPAPLLYAQAGAEATVQVGPGQIPGTATTDSVKKTKEVGPQGQVVEKEVRTTSSKRDHAAFKYSGVPCKWTGGVGNTGPNADLRKDSGPYLEYTVDRLPFGANPDEALWVKMANGKMLLLDPEKVQALR